MKRRRAIVVITEGAAPALLERFSAELPAFGRLSAHGSSGSMRSEFVPYEPSGLFSAFTGHPPAEHGCFSYWSVHSPDYRPRVLGSHSPRRPLLWHRPELADRTVAVVNVFGTHPVVPVNGYTVSYPMRRTLHACHPRDLAVRLARAGLSPIHDVNVWFSGQHRADFVSKVLEADETRAAAALHLLDGREGDRPDLTVVNLTAIDRLSHVYWQELEDGSPLPAAESAVLAAYRLADRVMGRLLDRVDDHTSLLAFSEIGFGPLRSYCSVNDVLAEAGLLKYDARGDVDWASSRAFESVQGSQGVNLNLVGRYRHGTVPPGDAAAVAEEVRAVLTEHVNPLTGAPLVAAVVDRDEIHTGAHAAEAPDLLLDPYDWRYLPLGDPHWASQVHRGLQSGWHRRGSYWGGVGAPFRPGAESDAATVDVAPTVMAMLGAAPPEDLVGTALGEVVT